MGLFRRKTPVEKIAIAADFCAECEGYFKLSVLRDTPYITFRTSFLSSRVGVDVAHKYYCANCRTADFAIRIEGHMGFASDNRSFAIEGGKIQMLGAPEVKPPAPAKKKAKKDKSQ